MRSRSARLRLIAASVHLLQNASNNKAATRDDIGYLRTKYIKVTTNPPQKVALDGEIIGQTPIEVQCITNALTIFFPSEQVIQSEEKIESLPKIKIKNKK